MHALSPIFTVDAFTDTAFRGNPAAVCLLSSPAPEPWMRALAAEMRHSETAFVGERKDGDYDLRWFTPKVEIELCGHATLASAHVLWNERGAPKSRPLRFRTKSGVLTCTWEDGRVHMDFPAKVAEDATAPAYLERSLGVKAEEVLKNAFDYLVLVESEEAVRAASPDFATLAKLPVRGAIVTAQASTPGYDFVSRFFAPAAGVDEDPVTGSAHCCLAPYWGTRLEKTEMTGLQASERGGTVHCKLSGDRVVLAGDAVTVWAGALRAQCREPLMDRRL